MRASTLAMTLTLGLALAAAAVCVVAAEPQTSTRFSQHEKHADVREVRATWKASPQTGANHIAMQERC